MTVSNHLILHGFCWCLNCTFSGGVFLPCSPAADGLLFSKEPRLSHSFFCSRFLELPEQRFSLTTGIVKHIVLNTVSLNANRLPLAWEAGWEGSDVCLILIASPGHELWVAHTGHAGCAVLQLVLCWGSEIQVNLASTLLGRLGLCVARTNTSVPRRVAED